MKTFTEIAPDAGCMEALQLAGKNIENSDGRDPGGVRRRGGAGRRCRRADHKKTEGQVMEQLRMQRPSAPVNEIPLPEGFSYERYCGLDAQIDDWLRICKEGLIAPDSGRNCFRITIAQYPDLKPEEDLIFVRSDAGERVATIAFVLHPGGVGYLHMVCCLEAFRGRGIGTAMTSHALARLEERGINYTYLTTDDFRLPAIRSYLSAGFVPSEDNAGMRARWDAVRAALDKLGNRAGQ